MRMTVEIDDKLAAEVQTLADEDGQSVSDVVERALRSTLDKRLAYPSFTTDGRGGLLPGVDLSDSARLCDIMEELC